MNNRLISAPEPQGPPLCRSYVSVFFDAISVRLSGEVGVHPEPMLWAVGVLSDGSPDYLGSWHLSDPKGPRWLSIAHDLKTRGAERIRFVIGPDLLEMSAAMAAQYRRGNRDWTVLPASGTTVEPSLIDSLLPGHRPYIKRALEVANSLSRHLKRALARRGSFAHPAAAEALLYESAERYFHANWPEPGGPPAPPQRVPRTTAWSGLPAAAN